jgi:hypothetical protein
MKLLDRFLSVGFKFHSYDEPGAGKAYEYKYYPDYMGDRHYTLVVFKFNSGSGCDWRLYVHNNSDYKYVDSIFQIGDWTDSNRDYISSQIDKIFNAELRDLLLENLLDYE